LPFSSTSEFELAGFLAIERVDALGGSLKCIRRWPPKKFVSLWIPNEFFWRPPPSTFQAAPKRVNPFNDKETCKLKLGCVLLAARRQWSSELWTHADWLLAHPEPHHLFRYAGISISFVYVDWMHTKHMGTDSWLYASVLWLLVYKMLPGSPDENLVQLWEQMRAFYKARHITGTYTNMFLGLFTKRRSPNTSYPKMRGKACEIKLLGEALLQVWLHYYDAASDIHGQIRLLLQYSVGLDAILHDNREVSCLPPAIFRQFMDTCERFLVLYSAVNRHFVDSGYLLFNVTPKLHLLWHAAHACQFIHSRHTWCYSGEDNMQHMRPMVQACLKGSKKWHVVNKLVDKFARGFTFRMQRQAAF